MSDPRYSYDTDAGRPKILTGGACLYADDPVAIVAHLNAMHARGAALKEKLRARYAKIARKETLIQRQRAFISRLCCEVERLGGSVDFVEQLEATQ